MNNVREPKKITFKHHLARKCHKAFLCFNKKNLGKNVEKKIKLN